MNLIYLMFLHFLADFVFQTDEMAKGKSSSLYWLTYHIMEYGLVLTVGLAWFLSPDMFLKYVAMNMGIHFVVDFFTSKIASKFYKEGKVHKFFVVIGFDQFLHFASLYLTAMFMGLI